MQKTAHYRRALWLVDRPATIERILGRCLDLHPDVESTKFEYRGGMDVQIAERSTRGGGIGIYFTLYSEGRRAATVQNGGPRVRRRPAPQGEEFLRTGIHLIVQGDHVAYVADGHTNDGQITALFQKFFEGCGTNENEVKFALMPRADRNQIERLLRDGVKSIDLGVTAFETAVDQMNDDAPARGLARSLSRLGTSIRQFGRSNRTAAEIEAASEIQARLHLGYDGRSAHHLVPVVLAHIAGNISDAADEFKIVTSNDVVITQSKLVIRRDVTVDGDDVAVDTNSAFTALRDAMNHWRTSGVFEQ